MAEFSPPANPSDPVPPQAPQWVPRVRTGYFYINDRRYYLYADKRTVTLRDATVLIYELASVPNPETVQVFVEGIPYRSFEVRGRRVAVKLDDQESFFSIWSMIEYDISQWGFIEHGFAFGPSNEVTIVYDALQWVPATTGSPDPTGNFFNISEVTETFRVKDADEIEYQLTKPGTIIVPTGQTLTALTLPVPSGFAPDPPLDGAPVVITDDTHELTDQRGFQPEFSVDPITGLLMFNVARNFIQNPSFEVTATGMPFTFPTFEYPLEWRVVDPAGFQRTGEAFHGTKCYQILGTGQLIQKVPVDPGQPYAVSAYFRNGTGEICVNFLDADGNYFDVAGMVTPTGEPEDTLCTYSEVVAAGAKWTRGFLNFGQQAAFCDATGIFPEIPADATEMEVKLRQVGGQPCVDAAMVEVGYSPTDFEPLDPGITIEYETSRRGYYQPNINEQQPLEINHLDLNPLRVAAPGGFLFIEEFSSVEDYQLGPGRLVEGQVPSPTGILQLTGSVGFEVGRRDLPYAKIDGFYKFRQRATFHRPNPAPVDDISDLTIEFGTPDPVPAAVDWVPRDGFRVSGDVEQLVVVPDSRLRYRLDALVYDSYENPAFTFQATAVAPSGLVNPDDPITNSQGQLVLFYTPPDVAGTGDLGKIDEITIQIGGVSLTLEVYGFRGSGLDYDEFLNVPYVAE